MLPPFCDDVILCLYVFIHIFMIFITSDQEILPSNVIRSVSRYDSLGENYKDVNFKSFLLELEKKNLNGLFVYTLKVKTAPKTKVRLMASFL